MPCRQYAQRRKPVSDQILERQFAIAQLIACAPVLHPVSVSDTRRYWFSSDGRGRYRLSRVEGRKRGVVTVRGRNEKIPYDGVWVNGERSPDTEVFIDGELAYQAPSLPFSRWSFEKHESLGGGHALP